MAMTECAYLRSMLQLRASSMVELSQGIVLNEICRRYKVRRLELFGSAATQQFDSAHSDLDFLVDFLPNADLGPWMKHYFDLKGELSRLYQREVDLVMFDALRNDQVRRQAEKTRTLIYDGSKDGEVVS
jgi:uncharacterized protein